MQKNKSGILTSIKKIFYSEEDNANIFVKSFNLLLLSIILIVFFWFALSRVGVTFDFSYVYTYRIRMIDGFLMTVYLSVASLFLSLALGTLTATMQSSKLLIFKYMSKFYVAIIRGTPLIVQIYLFHYIVGTAFGLENRFLSGVIILSLFEGAYISEIIRGSLLSLDSAQLEAAKAVGFTKNQTIRFVILPQLVSRTLPALTGQFASIIKDSSLLSVIAVIEITQTTREITATNYNFFEAYFVLGFLYLILTIPITFISQRVERRFSYENRN